MAKNEKEVDYDNLPLSEGKDESVSKGSFVCESHEVRDIIKKETGVSAGKKLFLKGTVKETGDVIEISQAIALQKDGVTREAGLWVKVIQGKLRIGTLVSMLKHYKIKGIGKVDGKKFKVVRNDAGYWVIDASE